MYEYRKMEKNRLFGPKYSYAKVMGNLPTRYIGRARRIRGTKLRMNRHLAAFAPTKSDFLFHSVILSIA